MSGIAGALFYDQAMAVAIGLFVSLAVSITIVPVVFHLLFMHAKEGKATHFIQRISFKHLDDYYTNIFHFIFHHKLIVKMCIRDRVSVEEGISPGDTVIYENNLGLSHMNTVIIEN